MSDFDTTPVTLADGYEAYAQYWPAHDPACSVLHLHGIQSHCGWYTETARAINAAGFAVMQVDRRGCGRNQANRGDAESAHQLIDDVAACVNTLRERSGVRPVHGIGVSWGGKLLAAAHVERPNLFTGLVLVTPGIFPVIDVSNAEKFKIGWAMVSAPHKQFAIPLNEPELFTADPRWMAFFREDPLLATDATAGFYLASRRMDRIVARLPQAPPVPLHLYLAGEERIIDNARTRRFVEQLDWPQTVITTYAGSRHTFEFSPARNTYVNSLTEWLKETHEAARTEDGTGWLDSR